MKQTRAQKKAKLLAEAEAVIERLLDWEAANSKPNLTQIEDEVLKERKALGQVLAEALLEGGEQAQLVEAPGCERCGAVTEYKGQKRKGAGSRIGELAIARGYYYCPHCKRGVFPPGQPT